jgi:hypothetical protein
MHEYDILTEKIATVTAQITNEAVFSEASLRILSALAMFIRDKISYATQNLGNKAQHTRAKYGCYTSRSIMTSARAINGELSMHSVSEGTKSCFKFNIPRSQSSNTIQLVEK